MVGRFLIALSVVALSLAQTAEQKPVAPPAELPKQVVPAPEAPQQRPIQVQVNEVIVPVTVTDEKNRFVSNLDAKDFRIFDEGKEQHLHFFSREHNQPVVVGFLIDMSNATRLHWKTYQDAAIELVLNLLPGDKKFSGYLITYGNEAELSVNTTNDSEPIVERLRKIKPGGGAAFYDAIYKACTTRKLVSGEPVDPRRVIVVIGDGHDNASSKTLDQVIELAQRNLVTIYGISTTAYGFGSGAEGNLERLAEETGGRVEYPLQNVYKDVAGYLSTPSDEGNFAYKVGTGGYASAISSAIFRAIANVSGEITTQYILRYVPNYEEDTKEGQRKFRELNVKVALP